MFKLDSAINPFGKKSVETAGQVAFNPEEKKPRQETAGQMASLFGNGMSLNGVQAGNTLCMA